MKITPDSPELTAYVLGELPPALVAEVEAAIAASPDLADEVASLERTARSMEAWLASPEAVPALDPDRRAHVLAAASARALAPGRAQANPFNQGPAAEPKDRPPGVWTLVSWAWTRLRYPLAGLAVAAGVVACVLWVRPGRNEMQVASTGLRYQDAPVPVERRRAPLREVVQADAKARRAPDMPVPSPPPAPVAVPPSKPASVPVAPRASSAGQAVNGPVPTAPREKAKAESGQRSLAATQAGSAPRPGPDASPRLANRYGLAPREPDNFERQKPATSQGLAGLRDSGAVTTEEKLEERSLPMGYGELAGGMGQAWDRASGFFRGASGEGYAAVAENDFLRVANTPLSTFGLDVDTASYANVRRFLREGSLPPRDAVRVEEMVNYFRYAYPAPRGDAPVSVSVEVTSSPWREGYKLVRVGIHARPVDRGERPPANLVFLIDVSGSMAPENKLPLVKGSLRLLLDRLDARDRVALVTYAAGSDVLAEPTPVDAEGKARLLRRVEGLQAGNGTHGSAGIEAAYALAGRHLQPDRVNRVVLCTDGDFNIGKTSHDALLELITRSARSGVFLTVLGFGMGNYQDATMELLADKGNGQYAYIDSFREARKVLGEELEGTLVTVAKDVKAQVEFNPARARSYRLVGYENRALQDRDFHDDAKDGGELGAGHQVTILYEVEPVSAGRPGVGPMRYQGNAGAEEAEAVRPRLKPGHEDELLLVKIRYKQPDGDASRLLEVPVKDAERPLSEASADVRFAAAVASHAMLLRGSPHRGAVTWEAVLRMAQQGMGADPEGYRAEFVDLVRRSMQLRR